MPLLVCVVAAGLGSLFGSVIGGRRRNAID